MATPPPLPKATAANSKLIASTPFEQLTERQKAYAQANGVTLQAPVQPTSPTHAFTPGAPAGFPTSRFDSTPAPVTPAPDNLPPDTSATGALTAFLQQQADDAKATATAQKDASNRDAAALIRQALATYNLPASLGDWAWQEIVAGKSQAEVMLDLYQRPEFKSEFGKVMDGRQKAGLSAMSPAEIIAYRNQAQQIMRAAGLPPGLHDSKDVLDQNMVDNVSAQEFHDRVAGAADAMFKWDQNEIRALQDHGLSVGDLVGMWLNPEKAQPLLERQAAAVKIGGAAYRTGYGQVTNDQADLYATQGVTESQAQTGFSALAHDQQLFDPLAGAGGSEDAITQADQLAAAFGGNNAQQRRIEQRRQQRQATFTDGGGFASAQNGISGIGAAPR